MQCTLSTLTSIRLAQLSRMWTILASIVWVVLALFYALEILCTHKSFHTFMPFSDCSAFQKSSFPFPFVNSYFKTHLGQDDLSVQDDSHSVMSNSLQPRGLKHARLNCPSPNPEAYSNSCPLSRWCHPTISSSVDCFSSCLQSFPASESFQMNQLFSSDGQTLEFQLQHQFFQWTPRTDLLQYGLAGSPCSPRDSQESSPTPQFKSINSSVLSLLHSPTLISIHDHRKNHSLE